MKSNSPSSDKTLKKFWFILMAGVNLLTMFVLMVPVTRAENPIMPKPALQEHVNINKGDKLSALALDQKNWKRPQSSFKWIAMASAIKTPWNSFGRQGWLTDDAYVEPVNPGISEFSPNTELFYLVFEVSALDAPSQYRAAWYFMPDGKHHDPKLVGTDALMMEMNEKAGYLEVFPPKEGWKKGKYLIKLFFESPGQELDEAQVVGTMTFMITDNPQPTPNQH